MDGGIKQVIERNANRSFLPWNLALIPFTFIENRDLKVTSKSDEINRKLFQILVNFLNILRATIQEK